MDGNDQQQNQQGNGTSIQVMPTTTVLGTNGQQILLQSLQQTLGANGQQQIQVLPLGQNISIGQGGTIIVQQPQVQQPQPQIVQLPDGQTFIYQPMIPEQQQQQPQIVNINGNYFQIPAQQQNTATATASIQNSPSAVQQPNQQVVMMTTAPTTIAQTSNDSQNAVTNIINTASASPPPTNSSSPAPTAESEEEPLYVNASKLNHICKNN